MSFNTMVVDLKNRRVMELVEGKRRVDLEQGLSSIENRENVRWVVQDMFDGFRSFAREFFPNAEIVADKFHVLRLMTPALNKKRIEITGDKRTNPVRRLLLRNHENLEFFERSALEKWLLQNPELHEIYWAKEGLRGLYRCRSLWHAEKFLDRMLERYKIAKTVEVRRLGETLKRWRREILNYFISRRTNAMVEGFNNKAKLVKRMGYGYRSFNNFRLRLLNACSG
jgi:transposase